MDPGHVNIAHDLQCKTGVRVLSTDGEVLFILDLVVKDDKKCSLRRREKETLPLAKVAPLEASVGPGCPPHRLDFVP